MISTYLQGMSLGLVLAIMVGPLTISLLHTSIEKGRSSGMAVAAGIWISDILFMLTVYFGFQYVEALIAFDRFEQYLGTAGSAILILIGMGIIKKKDKGPVAQVGFKVGDWLTGLTQGFSINTINPFTFIFWSSVMGAIVLKNGWKGWTAFVFFAGIMSTLFITDTVKVLLSKPLRKWLTPERWALIKKVSGISFIAFGVILLIRVFAP